MKPYYEEENVTIYHGDSREIILLIKDVDHVITDPPYSAKTHKEARTGGPAKKLVDFKSFTENELINIVELLITSTKRWLIMTCDWLFMRRLHDTGYLIRHGIWVKPNGTPQFTGDRPSQGWEAIAFMHNKCKKKWNCGGSSSVYTHNIVSKSIYPTQKPLSLISNLINDFTDAGETILDPFMGSGTTLVAARKCSNKSIGIDINEKACEIAAKRLMQQELF